MSTILNIPQEFRAMPERALSSHLVSNDHLPQPDNCKLVGNHAGYPSLQVRTVDIYGCFLFVLPSSQARSERIIGVDPRFCQETAATATGALSVTMVSLCISPESSKYIRSLQCARPPWMGSRTSLATFNTMVKKGCFSHFRFPRQLSAALV